MAERLPRAFGDYVLERRLGVGGMAETFVARRGATRQHVCVKRVLPAFSSDREFVMQFEREARLAGRLRHSNVVGVVDFGAVEGELFLALELVEGVDLRALLSSQPQRRLREDVAALIALDLAYALEYAHGEQVVHRDVTPSNVLLSVRGEVKLADFGVAKALTTSTLPTASGFLKGKVPYMAPEQMKGGAIDGRTDVFSLGVTLFEMLAGRRPFVGAHDVEVMMRVLAGERPRLSELAPGTTLEPLLDAALAVDHGHRPTTSELVQALAPLVGAGSRPELARLVRAAFGADVVEGERDTAFAPALVAVPRVDDSGSRSPSGSSGPVVPSTVVRRGVPAGAHELQATAPQRPLVIDAGDTPLAATAAARPGLLVGVTDAVVGSAAVAFAPSPAPLVEPDPASSSGVQPRAERFTDTTDPTAPLRAPAIVEPPPTLPTSTPSRTVIVGITIFVGLAAIVAFFLFRGSSQASPVAVTTPLVVETSPPNPAETTMSTSLDPTVDPANLDLNSAMNSDLNPAAMATPPETPRMAERPTMTEARVEPLPVENVVPPTMEPVVTMEPITTMEPVTTMEPIVTMEPITAMEPAPEATPTSERRGRVRVSLVPWGEVWLGERYMGRAPVDLELPVGTHTIRIGMGGRPIRSERIRVAEGRRELEFVFADE